VSHTPGRHAGGPLVYVDRSTLRAGRTPELRTALADLSALVEAHEPQIGAFAAFLDADSRTLTVIHVHRDAASLDRHLQVAAPAFPQFANLIALESIAVYGSPSPWALERLDAKVRLLGGAVTLHRLVAGFARLDQELAKRDPGTLP
jgi:hypothetical protein